jgi:Ca-activated chloride channel family protein
MDKYFEWVNPEFLFLLLIVPIIAVYYWFKDKKIEPEMVFSGLAPFKTKVRDIKSKLRHSLFVFRLSAFVFLILALARPQTRQSWQNVTTEGIDIVLSLDISGSMLAEDFKPNRLEASKKIATEFIAKRKTDRIGLVIFSGEAFTQCPLTTDHIVLKNLFMDIENGMIEDGTAIGMGLSTAVNRLKDSEAISKVVILLTDGVNNRGSIAPLTAAEIAREFGIRVYTIGVGTMGEAPYPVKTPFGTIQYQYQKVEIDEPTMKSIAEMTGGQYFRATNNESLRDIYTQIDLLEKSKIDVIEYRKKNEAYLPLTAMAALLFILEFILRNTYFKTIP